jgi:hypothetical protein
VPVIARAAEPVERRVAAAPIAAVAPIARARARSNDSAASEEAGDALDGRIEVHLPGGRWLSVGRRFDPRTLCQLLEVLESPGRRRAEREPA